MKKKKPKPKPVGPRSTIMFRGHSSLLPKHGDLPWDVRVSDNFSTLL